jgi:hypothetical protein
MMSTLLQALNTIYQSGGYRWHRNNAFNNIGREGLLKRDQWLSEVKDIYASSGGSLSWKQALALASQRRKTRQEYKTVKERVIESYTGRQSDKVKCNGPVCPGKYNKPASISYRPYKHENKRVLSHDAAVKLLKKHYIQKSSQSQNQNQSQRQTHLKRDISQKRQRYLTPCPTVPKVDKLNRIRNIPVKTPECADNWLFRRIDRYDMAGVDYGNDPKNILNK